MEILADTPKHLDLIYDVGMHKGEDTEFYLRKEFRVVAFEADPDLIALCKKRLKKFVENGQLKIIEGAIVSLDLLRAGHKTVPFYKNNDCSVWGTVSADWAERNARLGTASSVIEVTAVNFEDVLRTYGVPYFMKIDIEGCDKACLEALGSFEERPSYVSIESDKMRFTNVEREIDLLIDLGYTSFKAVEQSGISRSQSVPYPAREGKYVSHRFADESSGLFGAELGGKWKSQNEILSQYRIIHLSYRLVGEDGIITKWRYWGADLIRRVTGRFLRLFTRAVAVGWYDTHARHFSVTPSERCALEVNPSARFVSTPRKCRDA